MNVFDDLAVEAANSVLWEGNKVFRPTEEKCLIITRATLNAALASLRDRGKLTEGKHMALSESGAGNIDFGSSEFWRGDFKFVVVRGPA